MRNRRLHWGILYYCVYQGRTLPTLNSWFFKISPYQHYYLDCRSSLTQWAHPVSGNHGNNLIKLISESEYLLQSCLSEHLPPFQSVFVIIHQRLLMERFSLVFVLFVGWDCFLACWEKYLAYACPVLIIKWPNTSSVYLREETGLKIVCVNFFSHVTPQRCNYIKNM